MLCGEVVEILKRAERIVVVHHWDADGVSSAALLAGALSVAGFAVPRIGFYSASAVPLDVIRETAPDVVVLVDYGISDVYALEGALGVPVAVLDHHISKAQGPYVCNPVVSGLGGESDWPSASYLVWRLFGGPADFAALGIVGDLGWLPGLDLGRWLPGYGRDVEAVRQAADLIDSCYRAGDYGCIERARGLLTDGLERVLSDSYLADVRRRVWDEYERVLSTAEPEKLGDVFLYRISTNSYITSLLGRSLAVKHKGGVVVLVNWVRSLGVGYIYVRGVGRDLRYALEQLRARGLKVGGKESVFVVEFMGAGGEELGMVLEALRAQ